MVESIPPFHNLHIPLLIVDNLKPLMQHMHVYHLHQQMKCQHLQSNVMVSCLVNVDHLYHELSIQIDLFILLLSTKQVAGDEVVGDSRRR
jgi:rRNA maturation protein Rpf1